MKKKKTAKAKKTVRKIKAKKVVRRAKPKRSHHPRCPLSSMLYVKDIILRKRPSPSTCMSSARRFALNRRTYHQAQFCRHGSCRPRVRCLALAYYCYRLRKEPKYYRLLIQVRAFCKCIPLPVPSTKVLVVYNCGKAK